MMLRSRNIESKIPNITGIASTAALTAAEDKIPNISHLVKMGCQIKKWVLVLQIIVFSKTEVVSFKIKSRI